MNKLALVVALLCPALAYGQVSIVNALPDIMAEEGWSNTIAASGSYRRDNNYDEELVLSAAGSSLYKQRVWAIYGLTKGAYDLQNGNTQELSVMEHVRARITLAGIAQKERKDKLDWWDRFFLESFIQHEFDQFRLLDTRFLLGAGPAVHLLHDKHYNLMFGTAYMFEYLNFTLPLEEFNHRWSSYLQFQLEINERLQIDAVTFAQFRFDDMSDFLWMGSVALTTNLTDNLSLQLGLGLNHDTRPPPGAKHFGVQTNSAVLVEF